MLHYAGDITAMALGDKAKFYIHLYENGEDICLVPFIDLEKGRKRFVKFEKLASVWCFVDLVG